MNTRQIFPYAARHLLAVLAVLLLASPARADFTPEAVGNVNTLPATYPDHWLVVHDASFFHMLEGKMMVIDPLGETLGDQFKGIMTSSFIGAYQRHPTTNEHYVIETFYSRGGRGGERTDTVTFYDPASLSVSAEVVIPPKRLTGMPKVTATGLIGDNRFLGVYNFTPSQSVSIVDLEQRTFVGEVSTPGCGFVVPNGQRSFTSICANGSFLTSQLDADGKLQDSSQSAPAFDANDDPIFESAAVSQGIAYFPTFSGRVLPVDVRNDQIVIGKTWWLTSDQERNWRPGGMNLTMVDSAGDGYFLMNPAGGEGTHKDGGTEVWRYDLAQGKRIGRIELSNWGLSLGTTGAVENRLMLVTNAELGIDVYRLPGGEYVRTLDTGNATPFLIHGAY